MSTRINIGFVLLLIGVVVMILLVSGCAKEDEGYSGGSVTPGAATVERDQMLAAYPALADLDPPYAVHLPVICEYLDKGVGRDYVALEWAQTYYLPMAAAYALVDYAMDWGRGC